MLETGIFCVILLAVGYWTAMYVMGRRADVIHGKFVHADDEAEFAPAQMPTRHRHFRSVRSRPSGLPMSSL